MLYIELNLPESAVCGLVQIHQTLANCWVYRGHSVMSKKATCCCSVSHELTFPSVG